MKIITTTTTTIIATPWDGYMRSNELVFAKAYIST